MRETHTGVVVLAGDRAFKAKKPVSTDFLDFRTLEQRESVCFREVKLNSRLSPDSYLGVAHLTDPTGGPAEPIVVMRRYHDEDRLASMVTRDPDESGDSVRGVLDTIAGVLARFHERAERGPAINAQGEAGAIDRRWRQNLSELDRYVDTLDVSAETVSRIQRLAAEFIAGREPLFAHRIEEGLIVDGHGDLLADDIFCVQGEPALLDCLEFDDELRYVDCIDDAAFLAMDLEFLGRKDLGDYFLQRYALYSAHSAPSSLRDFYIAYRAVVRAKVDCVRAVAGQIGGHRRRCADTSPLRSSTCRTVASVWRWSAEIQGPASRRLRMRSPKRAGAQVISTDEHTSGTTGSRRHHRRRSGVLGRRGCIAPDNVATVYDVALRRARQLLGDGQSVILDGTWRDPHARAHAHRLASETHSAMVELMCVATNDTAAERIATEAAATRR